MHRNNRVVAACVVLFAAIQPAMARADEKSAVKALSELSGTPVHVGLDDSKPIFKVEFSDNKKFSDDDLKKVVMHLKELPDLRALQLGFTKVTDKGLANLAELEKLEELGLAGTPVSDAGLEHLKKLSKLTSINLVLTKVTDKGVEDLKKALPKAEITHKIGKEK